MDLRQLALGELAIFTSGDRNGERINLATCERFEIYLSHICHDTTI
jgi:glutamyl-tRNA reductase